MWAGHPVTVYGGCLQSPVDMSRGVSRQAVEVSRGLFRVYGFLSQVCSIETSSQGGCIDSISQFYLASIL